MLNQSNKNVPTRRVRFYSFKADITRRLKEDHSELQSYTHVGASEIHPLELEIPERIALLGYKDYSPWEVTDFRLTHVWEDSAEQFVY
jgi:hypothetical protein